MCPTKTFKDFVNDNINISASELSQKIYDLDIDVTKFLTRYLLLIGFIPEINRSIMILCCSIMEYLKYRFQESLTPSDN